MIRKIAILAVSLSGITACAVNEPKNTISELEPSREYNVKYLNRAKELYSCGNYFHIVSGQRKKQSEIDRYKNLSIQAKDLAEGLILRSDGDPKKMDAKLAKKYHKKGVVRSIEMVKEIGRDRTGTKFNDMTISCYKTVQREDLFESVSVINKRQKDTGK